MKRKFELKCVRYGYDKFQSQVSREGGNIAPKTNDEFDIQMKTLMLTYEDPGANDGSDNDCTSLNQPQGLFQAP